MSDGEAQSIRGVGTEQTLGDQSFEVITVTLYHTSYFSQEIRVHTLKSILDLTILILLGIN